jgi:7-cyano-7-deazaguanine synthase
MWIDKAATWIGGTFGQCLVDVIVRETVTCYAGDPTAHEWGKGCGTCPACKLRLKGFDKYRAA